MQISLRKISTFVFRKPSKLVHEINSNAMLIKWCKDNQCNDIFKHRFDLYEHVNSIVLNSEPIDYIELGVFRGASILKWAELNKSKASRFVGFDTFEGLPEAWDNIRVTHPKGTFTADSNFPKTDDPRVSFVKGLFQQTLDPFLQSFERRNRMVIHFDADLYTSTLFGLTKLDSILKKGDIIIFDEFFSSSNEFLAFSNYTKSYQRNTRVLAWVRKLPYEQVAIEFT